MKTIDTPQSKCRFGICRKDITPPVGIYHRVWGAAVHDRAAGIHRPLLATAMVFQSDESEPGPESRQVLIALDHCLLGEREIGTMVDAVVNASGLARQSVVVVFSHTHAAGLMSYDRASLPGGERIGDYLEQMNRTVADCVAAALASVEPATITYGEGHCDLAANRDLWDADSEQWVCDFNPDGVADDTVVVARVTGLENRWLASMVNYACHPTTLAWQNRQISPDFPGAMRELVEKGTGAPCVFVQGASGDMGPRYGFVGDAQVADRNGRQLGYAALEVLEGMPPPGTRYAYAGPVVSGATIGTWSHVPMPLEQQQRCAVWQVDRQTVPLAYRPELPTVAEVEEDRRRLMVTEEEARAAGNAGAARDARALVERKTRLAARLRALPQGDSFPYEIVAWRVGDAIWMAFQGEPYNRLQRALRERFPGTPILVAALANGWGPSYLPPQESYGKATYQETVAVLRKGCLEQVMDEARQRIEGMMRGE
ncbi:MAG: neutral/alkaline non-lysosomal ceramidase N-terminal domain-containing protein [Pirellulaceae bacterium]